MTSSATSVSVSASSSYCASLFSCDAIYRVKAKPSRMSPTLPLSTTPSGVQNAKLEDRSVAKIGEKLRHRRRIRTPALETSPVWKKANARHTIMSAEVLDLDWKSICRLFLRNFPITKKSDIYGFWFLRLINLTVVRSQVTHNEI